VQPFDYVAWLEDPALPTDDEDHEWCAVFIVLADSASRAKAWGDVLTRVHCSESEDVLLHSSVEPHICSEPVVAGEQHPCPNFPVVDGPGLHQLPAVLDGQLATSDFIGW
jgi:hypothetical protein